MEDSFRSSPATPVLSVTSGLICFPVEAVGGLRIYQVLLTRADNLRFIYSSVNVSGVPTGARDWIYITEHLHYLLLFSNDLLIYLFCLYMCMWCAWMRVCMWICVLAYLHVWVCTHVWHVETWSWHQEPSSILLHFIYWVRVSQWHPGLANTAASLAS